MFYFAVDDLLSFGGSFPGAAAFGQSWFSRLISLRRSSHVWTARRCCPASSARSPCSLTSPPGSTRSSLAWSCTRPASCRRLAGGCTRSMSLTASTSPRAPLSTQRRQHLSQHHPSAIATGGRSPVYQSTSLPVYQSTSLPVYQSTSSQ